MGRHHASRYMGDENSHQREWQIQSLKAMCYSESLLQAVCLENWFTFGDWGRDCDFFPPAEGNYFNLLISSCFLGLLILRSTGIGCPFIFSPEILSAFRHPVDIKSLQKLWISGVWQLNYGNSVLIPSFSTSRLRRRAIVKLISHAGPMPFADPRWLGWMMHLWALLQDII